MGALTNPNMVVIGQIGRGKSAFVKTYLWRLAVFGRRAWVVDPKGEYGALGPGLGSGARGAASGWRRPAQPARRRARTPTCAGTDDEDDGDDNGASCSPRSAAASLGRSLLPTERSALDLVAVAVGTGMQTESAGRRCPRSSTRCCTPHADAARAVGTDVAGLAADGRNVALELRRLVAGDLRGMFDGPTSPGIRLDAPLVVLDLSAVYHSAALGILMTCATAWLQPPGLGRASGRTGRRGRGGGRSLGHPRQPGRGAVAPVVVEIVPGPGSVERRRAPPVVGPRDERVRWGPSRSDWRRGCWRTPRPGSSTPSPRARSSGPHRCSGCRRPKQSSSRTCDAAWRCGRSAPGRSLVQHRLVAARARPSSTPTPAWTAGRERARSRSSWAATVVVGWRLSSPVGARRNNAASRGAGLRAARPADWRGRRGSRRRRAGTASPPVGPHDATCAPWSCGHRDRVASRWARPAVGCWRPSAVIRSWWWDRPRAARRAASPSRPSSSGTARWWPRRSSPTWPVTRSAGDEGQGQVWVYDPPRRRAWPSASWSPLQALGDVGGCASNRGVADRGGPVVAGRARRR